MPISPHLTFCCLSNCHKLVRLYSASDPMAAYSEIEIWDTWVKVESNQIGYLTSPIIFPFAFRQLKHYCKLSLA